LNAYDEQQQHKQQKPNRFYREEQLPFYNDINNFNSVLVEANNKTMRTSIDNELNGNLNNGYDEANSSLRLSTTIPNVIIESVKLNQLSSNASRTIKHETVATVPNSINNYDEIMTIEKEEGSENKLPIKRTAIIETKPEFQTTTLMLCRSNEHNENYGLRFSDFESNDIIYDLNPEPDSIAEPNPLRDKSTPNVIYRHNSVSNISSEAYKLDANFEYEEIRLSGKANVHSPPSPRRPNSSNQSIQNDLKRTSYPTSKMPTPAPQFPAIGEDEINELHPNYTVKRTGEIIEKNGTYYSSDGTIRGYSGTVKKIANSKCLADVLIKQQELEQKHEREYENMLQKQKQNHLVAEKKLYASTNSLLSSSSSSSSPPPPPPPMSSSQTTNNQQQKKEKNTSNGESEYDDERKSAQPNALANSNLSNANKNRLSLGHIIASEKKSTMLPSNGGSLINNSNVFKRENKGKSINVDGIKSAYATVDNELFKKLENRKQIIANNDVSSGQPPNVISSQSHAADSIGSSSPPSSSPSGQLANLKIETNIKSFASESSVDSMSTVSSSSTNTESSSIASTMLSPNSNSYSPSVNPTNSNGAFSNGFSFGSHQPLIQSQSGKALKSTNYSHSNISNTLEQQEQQQPKSKTMLLAKSNLTQQILSAHKPTPLTPKAPSSSFVMSAKSKSNTIANHTPQPPPPPLPHSLLSNQNSSKISNFYFKQASNEAMTITQGNGKFLQPSEINAILTNSMIKTTEANQHEMHLPQSASNHVTPFPQSDATHQSTFISFGKETQKPAVAPKNFSDETFKSLSRKAQMFDQRENLMSSIRGFNITSLKKTKTNEES
jgi:hypothetical protein